MRDREREIDREWERKREGWKNTAWGCGDGSTDCVNGPRSITICDLDLARLIWIKVINA